jgi:cell division protein ZapA (FtsZ GTPase activity inhibitor)
MGWTSAEQGAAAESMMKGVNVEIMGQSLTVMSDGGDEWAKTLAATVDEKISYIRANSRAVNSVSVAILAALNFADELERLKRDHQALIDQIEALNRRLSVAMDS